MSSPRLSAIAALVLAATACAKPPTIRPAVERLRAAGVAFAPATIAVPDKLLADSKARSAASYKTKQQHVLILVLSFASEEAATAAREPITSWATDPMKAVLHYPRASVRGAELLLVGTTTSKPLAPQTAATLKRLQKAFEN